MKPAIEVEMTDTYLLKENAELLAAAQRIFGDIVVKAYVATTYFERMAYGEHVKELDKIASSLDIDDTSIRYDEDWIILDFANGKRVYFENSEWASLGAFNDDFMIVDQESED